MCTDPDAGDFSLLSNKDANILRMILGEYGIQILEAINRGARTRDTIPLISGVPPACVGGRMPVLLELSLVIENDELTLTERGLTLLELIGYCI